MNAKTFDTLNSEYGASMTKQHPRRVAYRCTCGELHSAIVTGMTFRGWEPIKDGALTDKWPHEAVKETR